MIRPEEAVRPFVIVDMGGVTGTGY